MQSFLAGQEVKLSFELAALGPVTSVEYRIVDHKDVVLVPRAALSGFTPGSESAVVTIPASLNTLHGDETSAALVVYLFAAVTGAATAWTPLRASYRVVGDQELPIPALSFQSLASADLLAMDTFGAGAYIAASDEERRAALIEARNRISQLRFHYMPDDWQSRVSRYVDVADMELITASEFASFEAVFRAALCRAQILQANDLIQQGEAGGIGGHQSNRDQGIHSITIGESSTTYNTGSTGASTMSTISVRAVSLLARYIARPRIGRG